MTRDEELLGKAVEKALKFAHAAADRPTEYGIWEAKTYAEEVLRKIGRLQADAARRSPRLLALAVQLRAILWALSRTQDSGPPQAAN